jgi:hypothetical protein
VKRVLSAAVRVAVFVVRVVLLAVGGVVGLLTFPAGLVAVFEWYLYGAWEPFVRFACLAGASAVFIWALHRGYMSWWPLPWRGLGRGR